MGLPPIPGRGHGPKDGRRPMYLKDHENSRRIKVVSAYGNLDLLKGDNKHCRKHMPKNEKRKIANGMEVEDILYVDHTEFFEKKDIDSNQKLVKDKMAFENSTKDRKDTNKTNSILGDKKQKQLTLEKAIQKMDYKKETKKKWMKS